MKPEEAEKKWCPMTGPFKDYNTSRCASYECAVWVWDTPPSTNGKSIKQPGDGHCGLVKK